jgi:hypothetical protein
VLVGTNRRATLLGGFLRLVGPIAPPVARALRITGLDLQLDIFPTLSAAIAGAPASPRIRDAGKREHADMAGGGHAAAGVRTLAAVPGTNDLRDAVTAVLAHADAWRDADPNRRFTPTLRALARAHAGLDRTALIVAARSLLAALTRYPLTHSPAVAATATDLRRLLEPRPHGARPSGPAGMTAAQEPGRPGTRA